MKNYKKKAFAFSFLALFVSFLIFSFASLMLFKGDNTQQINFKNSRIMAVDSEFKYFKEVFLINSFKYSLYNSLEALNNESVYNNTFLKEINQNYSKLNSYLYELLLNGTLYGKNIPYMNNKTINYFLGVYKDSFKRNYKADLNVTIYKVNVFENKPYYVNLQIFGNYEVLMEDNLSNWNFNDSILVSVPVYRLSDPSFAYFTSFNNVSIRPVEYYLTNLDWDLNTFNSTLQNSYSFTYTEPEHNYLIGSSYISRLVNVSYSSYKDVLGFWSFDYDIEKGGVFDSSLHYNLSKLYGNSYLIMNYDDGNITDLTSYNHSATKIGDTNCSVFAFNARGCFFDGAGDALMFDRDKFNLNFTNKITITAWINPNAYFDPTSVENVSEVFRYGGGGLDVIDLRLTQNGLLEMQIGNHSNGSFYSFKSNENLTLGNWSFVAGSFDGDTGKARLYINGKLVNLNSDLSVPKSSSIGHFEKSIVNVSIGNFLPSLKEGFNGSIDEVGIYTKVLSDSEINNLFEEKKVKFIEYVDSLHGKGIEFDGVDDYVNLTTPANIIPVFNQSNFSVEIWFKPYDLDKKFNLIIQKSSMTIAYSNVSHKIFLRDNRGFPVGGASFNFSKDKYYYLVVVRDKNNNRIIFYMDGKLIGNITSTGWNSSILEPETSFASGNYPNVGPTNTSFRGVIDEIKIINRSLTLNEIKRNYYNYDSFSKGLANYFIPINPNKFGFNNSGFADNVSYSDKLFFDYYFRNITDINITLFNITNITSSQTNKEYFNFLFDICMKVAYSIDSFNNSVSPSKVVKFGSDSGDCKNLVSKGIY